MYQHARGVGKDFNVAFNWYQKSANSGYANAENSLGIFYENGQGVQKNLQSAIIWYRKAAKQGNKYAQNNLSRLGSNW
jgi:hypothetical protein